jgi:hypothetical protein
MTRPYIYRNLVFTKMCSTLWDLAEVTKCKSSLHIGWDEPSNTLFRSEGPETKRRNADYRVSFLFLLIH